MFEGSAADNTGSVLVAALEDAALTGISVLASGSVSIAGLRPSRAASGEPFVLFCGLMLAWIYLFAVC